MPKIAIIIPCFNEEKRLLPESYINFLKINNDFDLIFVNDGSTDNTISILNTIQFAFEKRVFIINSDSNKGKANAISEGMRSCISNSDYSHLGYLDADLSTSLEEFYRLFTILNKQNADYIFGSRIKMLHSQIVRSSFRHFSGRLIATLVDSKYNFGIYDTQCGAKCFKKEIISVALQEPFKTKWFFDIEIFLRIREQLKSAKGIEEPLKIWRDPGGSKMNILKLPKIINELYILFKKYPAKK